MSDLINRQAAIDAITRKMVSIPTAGEKDLMGDVNRIRAEDISVIRRLPSAQPDTYEALRILNAINSSGRLDYGDYCDLHDAISEIGVTQNE